jgi:flagellar biosynthetic protein FliP
MQVVILLTLLTLLPAAVMAMTPFLRITVVLHFLRQALGTQSTPRIRCCWVWPCF